MAKKWSKKEINEYLNTKQISQENYVAPTVQTNYQPSVQNTVQAFNSVEPTIKSVESTIQTMPNINSKQPQLETLSQTKEQINNSGLQEMENNKTKDKNKSFSFSIDNKKTDGVPSVAQKIKAIDPNNNIASIYDSDEYNLYYNNLDEKGKIKENKKILEMLQPDINLTNTNTTVDFLSDKNLKKKIINGEKLTSEEQNKINKLSKDQSNKILLDYLSDYYSEYGKETTGLEKVITSPAKNIKDLITGPGKLIGYKEYIRDDGLNYYLPDKEDIKNERVRGDIKSKIGGQLYDTLGGASKILVSSLNPVGEPLYWMSMYGDTKANAINSLTEQGKEDNGQATLNATLQTGLEYLTGKMLGSATKKLTGGKASGLEKTLSNKAFNSKVLQKLPENTRYFISNLWGQGGSEFTEEFTQEYLGNVVDILTLGTDGEHTNIADMLTDPDVFAAALYSGSVGFTTAGMLSPLNSEAKNTRNNVDQLNLFKTTLQEELNNTTDKVKQQKIQNIIDNIDENMKNPFSINNDSVNKIEQNINLKQNTINQLETPLNQAVLQQNKQQVQGEQTLENTSLNEVNQELEETRQNDIEDSIKAFNLEENLEEELQEQQNTNQTEYEVTNELKNTIASNFQEYLNQNNNGNLTQEQLQEYIQEQVEKLQNLTKEEKDNLYKLYTDTIIDYLEEVNKPRTNNEVKLPENIQPTAIDNTNIRTTIENDIKQQRNRELQRDLLKQESNQESIKRNLQNIQANYEDKGSKLLSETIQNDLEDSINALNLNRFTQKEGNYVYKRSDNTNIDAFRRNAATYLKNTPNAQAFVKVAEKIIKDKKISIRFDPKLGNNVNGTYKNGVITINPNSNRAGEFVAIHELTHAIGTKTMIDMIQKYRNSNAEFNNAVERLLSTYKTTEINEEALGDIAGQLFGNQEYINNLSMENPSLFKRIYNEIKYLWHQFTGYKNQNQFIEDLRNKWESAYRNSKVKQTSKTGYSLEERVSGDKLLDTQDLISEIKDVGAEVDDNGYVTVYHQTTDENAQKIRETGQMISKEPSVFFSTSKNASQSDGRGTTKLEFKIPAEELELDDIFSDNADVKIRLNGKNSLDISNYLVDNTQDMEYNKMEIGETKNIPINQTSSLLNNNGGRYMSIEEYNKLKSDIEKNGIKEPIEIYKDENGNFAIEQGNHRLQIAKEIGLKEVPIKMVESWENLLDKKSSNISNEIEEVYNDKTTKRNSGIDEISRDTNGMLQESNGISNDTRTTKEDARLSKKESNNIQQTNNDENKRNNRELDNSSFSLKEKQNDIIQRFNPVNEESTQTWIRSVDDIKTLEETLQDSDWSDYDEFNPDLTKQDIENAIKTGKITVYSSYPIEQGIFVSPSKIEAESYSGNGKVYSKEVLIQDVAWIDPTQGQYAKVDTKYSKDNQTWREYLEKEFPSQGTRTNLQDINERNKPLNKEEKTELDGLRALVDTGLINEEETARLRELERRNNIKETTKALNLEKETKPKYSINENAKDDYVSMKVDKAIQKNAYKNVNKATKTAENYLKFDREQKANFKDSIKKLSLKTREQLVNSKTYNQVKDIVNNFANVEYNFVDEELKSIKKEIKNTKINIPAEIREQITDYSDFRKQSKLNITKDGQNIDSIWQELSNEYPHIFSSDIQTEADMLYALRDLMNKDVKITEKYRIPDSDLKYATNKIYNSLLNNSITQTELDSIQEDLQIKASRRTRQVVQNELLNQMGITLEDIETGKDINAVRSQLLDPRRLNEEVFSPKVAKKINDATVNFVSEQEANSNRFKNKERQEIKDLGIKARSKESAAVQKYGEKEWINDKGELLKYGDKELARDFPNVETQEKIKNAARVLRNKYDNYIDKINASLEDMGYDPIPKRKDYFKHFYEISDKLSQWGVPFNANSMNEDLLPTDINGLTDEFKPGKNWFASAQQRTGKKTIYDAITGIDQYLDGASNLIFHTESIQRYRTLSKFIRDTYGQVNGLDNAANLSEAQIQKRIEDIQSNKLSRYAAWLDEQANAMAGKKGKIDRGIEEFFGRRVYSALNTLKSQVGSNMTGFNVRSAMTNFASAIQGASKIKKTAFLKGTLSTLQNMVNNDGLINKSNFLTNRFGSDSISKKTWQKVANAGQIFMTGTDYFTANQIWRSKYFENMSKGMSETQAIKNADDFAARIMGDRSKGQTAAAFNSKTLGFLTQFQLEVNNQWQSMIHDNKMDIKTGNKSGATVLFQLGQLAAMSNLFNLMMKSLTGNDVMFDPIDILKGVFKPDDDDKDKDLSERMRTALGKIVEQLPMASVFTGGRIPIGEAFKGVSTGVKYLTGGTNKWGQPLTTKDVKKDMLEALPYWILPTGWGQIRKTKQGLSMYSKDKPVAGSYTDSGNLRFTADTSLGGKTKSALFGQYSSKEAQDYIKGGFKTITKGNNIDELKNLGYTSSQYKKYRQELNAAGRKNQEKIDYIMGLDIPKKEKDVMASRVLRKPVNTNDIKKFDTLTEFNKWYKKNNSN